MLADSSFASVFGFARASAAYDVAPDGSLTAYSANQIRSNDKGWLLEGQATNTVPNSTGAGAVVGGALPTGWTVPGSGLTCSVASVGTINGLSYVDIRMQGVANTTGGIGFAPMSPAAANIGEVWTVSVYVALVGGSLANINPGTIVLRVHNEALGGTNVVPDATLRRVATGPTTLTAALQRPFFRFNANDTVTPIDATFRFAGWQSELNYHASSWIPTTNSAVTRSPDNLSISGSALTALLGGLPVRQNLLLHSGDLSNAAYSRGGVTIATDATTDPAGGTTADQLVENTSAATYHWSHQGITKPAASMQYTYSLYLKDAGRAVILQLQSSGSNGVVMRVDPSNGSIVSAASIFGTGWSGASGTVTAAGAGWWRVTLTGTSDTATGLQAQIALYSNVATSSVYTGDGASGVFVAFQQVETGPTATAYIPTTTMYANAGGSTQGCVVIDAMVGQAPVPTGQYLFDLTDPGAQYRLAVRLAAGSLFPGLAVLYAGTVTGGAGTASPVVVNQAFRVGLRWGGGVASICLNGGAIASFTGTLPVGLATLALGAAPGPSQPLNGRISKARVYPYAPTDAEFQNLCTLGT